PWPHRCRGRSTQWCPSTASRPCTGRSGREPWWSAFRLRRPSRPRGRPEPRRSAGGPSCTRSGRHQRGRRTRAAAGGSRRARTRRPAGPGAVRRASRFTSSRLAGASLVGFRWGGCGGCRSESLRGGARVRGAALSWCPRLGGEEVFLSVFADERVQVWAFFGAGALEFGDEVCPVSGVGGHAAVDAGEAFVAVNFAGVGAGALAAGGGADVGEVGGERPGVAAVDPLVDAGDGGAALGGLGADVGDDGLGFVFGGGVVGEAVEDDADG